MFTFSILRLVLFVFCASCHIYCNCCRMQVTGGFWSLLQFSSETISLVVFVCKPLFISGAISHCKLFSFLFAADKWKDQHIWSFKYWRFSIGNVTACGIHIIFVVFVACLLHIHGIYIPIWTWVINTVLLFHIYVCKFADYWKQSNCTGVLTYTRVLVAHFVSFIDNLLPRQRF